MQINSSNLNVSDIPQVVTKRVFKFVDAAQKSGWTLEIFIDAAAKTNETIDKWKSRRENEVLKGIRNLPQGCNSLLGDMFKRAGIKVHYSLEADCDDTIISYAYHVGAAVLSNDNDMFRYSHNLEIYREYCYEKGELVLEPQLKQTLNPSTPIREIISPPPKTIDRDPGFVNLHSTNQYLRGSPSPLTSMFGNLHLIVRPLRVAAYHRLKVKGPVREEFPIWDINKKVVIWQVQEVFPDNKLETLLENPKKAIDYFFPSLEKPPNVDAERWWNHIFAINAVIYEIISVSTEQSLLDLMEKEYISFVGLKPDKSYKLEKQKLVFQKVQCIQCKLLFEITESEKNWMLEKKLSLPKRCKNCRKKNKENK